MDETLRLKEDDFLVFADETGHERFADPHHPVFGWGGCALPASLYEVALAIPWRGLKEAEFGGADVALHAADVRVTALQEEALARFFRANTFGRFAAVLKSTTSLTDILGADIAFRVPIPMLLKRICDLLQWTRCTSVAVVLEENHRLKSLTERETGSYWVEKVLEGGPVKVPLDWYWSPKRTREPGLEVADFVAHAAGVHVRRRMRGQAKADRFTTVFEGVPDYLLSYLEADTAVWEPRHQS